MCVCNGHGTDRYPVRRHVMLARLYECTESYCCHFDSALVSHFKVLRQSFLCYGQGTVRRAILYRDRTCFIRAPALMLKFYVRVLC